MSDPFASDYRPNGEPYWWSERVANVSDWRPGEQMMDVAVIGSGFTGLSAAIELAEAGQNVLIIEAETVGYGASTRNGGLITPTLHETPDALAQVLGHELAERMTREAQGLVTFLESQVLRFGIDCDFRVGDHFMGAYTAAHYDRLAHTLTQFQRIGMPMRMIPKTEQRRFIDTAYYQGGRLHEGCASVHPAKYHRGLVRYAGRADVRFIDQCRVTGIKPLGAHFRLETTRGPVTARQVLMATNGYTSPDLAWYRRRIVPLQSSIIATEDLGLERVAALFPNGAIINDTKRILSYFRPSPDRRRVIFGGRATFRPIDHRETARRLRKMMLDVFPQLEDIKISHCWGGFVGFTFDFVPHAGQKNGVDYALGYCGSGVAMASWLGHRTAQRMLGRGEPSAFEAVPLKRHPLYMGNTWMLPLIGEYFRIRDRIDRAVARQ